jgi:hypothetical protein
MGTAANDGALAGIESWWNKCRAMAEKPKESTIF